MRTQTRGVSDVGLPLAGPLIWAAHFGLTYFAQAAFCSIAPSHAMMVRWIGAALTAVAILLLLRILRLVLDRADRVGDAAADESRFLRNLAIPFTALAAIAVVWSTIAMLFLPVCGPLAA